MNDIRDIIHQWETIDRTRNDLRNWLHSKQEDLHEIESRPSKLHPEAAELEIANLQVKKSPYKYFLNSNYVFDKIPINFYTPLNLFYVEIPYIQ